MTFKALPPANTDAAAFLQQLNAEGQDGYRYVGDQTFSDGTFSIFVNDGLAPTYSYALGQETATAGDLLTQANAEGAQGFRYVGPYGVGGGNMTLYRKDAGTSATYTYLLQAPAASPDDFLAEANKEGSLGFWYVGPLFAGEAQDLFMTDAASTATYGYRYAAAAATPDGLAAQLDDQGSNGYRYKGNLLLGNAAVNLYVKDLTQAATFSWQSQPAPASSAGFISQANGLALNYFAPVSLGSGPAGTPFNLYFSAQSCAGFLCKTLSPLTQN